MSTATTQRPHPPVPTDIAYRWRKLLVLMLAELQTPIALICRQGEDGPEVFCAQADADNPFPEGGRPTAPLELEHRVMARGEAQHLPDLADPSHGRLGALLALGLRDYHGHPLRWPDGAIFGSLSLYGRTPHAPADAHQALAAELAHAIEQDLQILVQQEALRAEVARRRQAEAELAQFTPKEFHALWHAAQAVLAHRRFDVAARIIFDEACAMTGARAGYVALLSDDGSENEVLFLEAGGAPCSVDPRLPMPIRGLRAEAYHSGQPVYHNDFMASEWTGFMPEGHVALRNVMFAPLNIDQRTVGIIGLANKEGDFTDFDATVAGALGEVAAIALKNSRNLDQLDQTNQRLEEFNQTLVEREMRIIEVKQEVNRLCQEFGRTPPYTEVATRLAD
jgi:GAF domain-containing protein